MSAYEELKAWCEKWGVDHYTTKAMVTPEGEERDASVVLIGIGDAIPIYFCADGDIEVYAIPNARDDETFWERAEKQLPCT